MRPAGRNHRTGSYAVQQGRSGSAGGSTTRVLPAARPARKLAAVEETMELSRLLQASSDPDNPPVERIETLLRDVRHIAVVGLSRNLEKPARRVPSYLAAKGYDVIPVNPHAKRLLGRSSYDTLSEVPAPVDLALIFRPSEDAGAFVREAMERSDEPAIWLQTGIRADAEADEARGAGRTVIQDLCIFRVHRVLNS